MRELGIEVPDPSTRAGAAVAATAGADRARRPAAGRPRGRRGRRGRRSVQALDRRRPDRRAAARHPHARSARTRWPCKTSAAGPVRSGSRGGDPPIASPGARARLDRILGREKGHRTGGGWISGAIYGANDGLASVFGIVAGVSGATGGSSSVLTAGLAGAIASALSMATGRVSGRALRDRGRGGEPRARAPGDRQHPEEEKEELSLFYQLKGVDEETADAMAEQIVRSTPTRCCRRWRPRSSARPPAAAVPRRQAALAAGISTGLGAIIPVIPFMFTHRDGRDRAGRGGVADRPLPGRRREVAGDAAQLVGGRPGDDAGRRDRRRRDLPDRAGAADAERSASVVPAQTRELGAQRRDLGLERGDARLEIPGAARRRRRRGTGCCRRVGSGSGLLRHLPRAAARSGPPSGRAAAPGGARSRARSARPAPARHRRARPAPPCARCAP